MSSAADDVTGRLAPPQLVGQLKTVAAAISRLLCAAQGVAL